MTITDRAASLFSSRGVPDGDFVLWKSSLQYGTLQIMYDML